jgi:hypothetical protein
MCPLYVPANPRRGLCTRHGPGGFKNAREKAGAYTGTTLPVPDASGFQRIVQSGWYYYSYFYVNYKIHSGKGVDIRMADYYYENETSSCPRRGAGELNNPRGGIQSERDGIGK